MFHEVQNVITTILSVPLFYWEKQSINTIIVASPFPSLGIDVIVSIWTR